jgi:hypothetical protein
MSKIRFEEEGAGIFTLIPRFTLNMFSKSKEFLVEVTLGQSAL